MTYLRNIAIYFVAEKLKSQPALYRKALVLIYIHWAMIGVSLLMTIINQGILHERDDSSYLAVFIIGFMLLIFKRYGNFILAGNLVAISWFLFLAPTINATGGVHSDDMVWLMLGPLMVLLFSNRNLGFFWLIVLHLFYIGTLFYGKSHPEMNRIPYSDNYYVINYIVLSSFIFLLLKIIEASRIITIKKLNEKNALLEAQKQAILEQTVVLKAIEQRLMKSNEDLENFAYTSSHDLKEPLRMVRMYTEFLRRSLGNQLNPNQVEFMSFVTDGVIRMQNLLDDLLKYSRLGKNTEDIKNIDLNERLLVVKNNLTVLIQETNAEILSDSLPNINASMTEMSQLFQNIIANAIKFRKSNETPKISVKATENKNEYTISIEDNGIGIKKEYQEQVFTLFQRLHSHAAYEGSGIGLATCKKIIDNMGGRMWLTSTEGVGTTFYFVIPKEVPTSMSSSLPIKRALVA
jgi:signal transduction histidine kinase